MTTSEHIRRMPTLFLLATGTVILGGLLFVRYLEQPNMPPIDARYLDPELVIEARIDDLLMYMTLEEKIGQMALVDKNSIKRPDDVRKYRLGALLSGAGAKPDPNTPESWRTMVEEFTSYARRTRLGIPLLYGVDAAHGHTNIPGATVFPHQIGLGAANDPRLVEQIAEATARELEATGIYWNFAPSLDLPTDIRWGRVYETYSDDPVRTAMLGAAYVRGMQAEQGTSTRHVRALSTAKHYVGLGAMEWGSSRNKNFKIDQGRTAADEARLRAEFLPPFESAIDAGALSIMAGLNWWGDLDVAAERYLLTDVLKEELGFRGFVVSDWYGVYEIPGGTYRATVTAVNAGIDMVMLPFDYQQFVRDMKRAVRRNDISVERVDDAVRRILRAKFALGLFDGRTATESVDVLGNEEHRALAREAVARSMVLLKNEARIVPVTPDVRSIRVSGSAAHDTGRQSGAWTVEWQGIEGTWLPGATSILDGLRAVAGTDVMIEYHKDGTFDSKTSPADLGIAIVGEAPYAEGWGDNPLPQLTPEDLRAIESLKEHARHVLVILVTGRPLFITDSIATWDALLVAWLPGSEGAGVADVVFGRRVPTGTLPMPWPRDLSQLPLSVHGNTSNGTPVLFPRGAPRTH